MKHINALWCVRCLDLQSEPLEVSCKSHASSFESWLRVSVRVGASRCERARASTRVRVRACECARASARARRRASRYACELTSGLECESTCELECESTCELECKSTSTLHACRCASPRVRARGRMWRVQVVQVCECKCVCDDFGLFWDEWSFKCSYKLFWWWRWWWKRWRYIKDRYFGDDNDDS